MNQRNTQNESKRITKKQQIISKETTKQKKTTINNQTNKQYKKDLKKRIGQITTIQNP